MDFIIEILITVPAVLIAIIFHEFSHGIVSYAFGDPTPKETGRLSLNPLKHLDPIGTLCLLLFHFGWAKPVMINPNYYKKPRLAIALVALAGPFSNFIIAILSALIYVLGIKNNWIIVTNPYFLLFMSNLIFVNIGLGVFNLIPLPPLDGSKILGSFLSRETNEQFQGIGQYGTILIFIILFLGQDLFSKIIVTIYNFIISLFL